MTTAVGAAFTGATTYTHTTAYLALGYRVDESKLTPYIPQDTNESFLVSCETAVPILPVEISVFVLSFLNSPIDLTNASEVCKNFYLASKNMKLWENMTAQFFPEVQVLNPCLFSGEQQFKIVFQRVLNEQKLISLDECQVQKTVSLLRGPDGNNGLIDAHQKIARQMQGQIGMVPVYYPWAGFTTFGESIAIDMSSPLTMLLNRLVGDHYDGTEASLPVHSTLSHFRLEKHKCLQKYSDQEAFEAVIRAREQSIAERAEKAKCAQENDAAKIEEIMQCLPLFDEIPNALDTIMSLWNGIITPSAKMQAFLMTLQAPFSTEETALPMYESLSDDLKNAIKHQIWLVNDKKDDGHGFGFGDYIIATDLHGPLVKQAVYNVCQNLLNNAG